ncbi:extracellular solute-binding protein [Paenibacillus sp. LjRoot153]|uniref:extracellular solute-binding protein n=1 Tax=Paenibacillus sp. LjRoot153 TaxID=3342270 RepID=UPI003ECD9E43
MKVNRLLSLVISVALLFTFIIGCSAKKDSPDNSQASNNPAGSEATKEEKPIKLTFFDKNTGDTFTNPVAQEITKRTGVTIEIQQPTGNPAEKLNLMLASNDLPDIILMERGSDLVNKYISAGAIIPLNDLIDKYGPDVKKMYGDTLNKTRYKDGKNYYLSNWYGLEKEPVLAFSIRKNWLKELAPDKAEGGVPFTADEFKKLLQDFKTKYPQIDGKETIPLTMNGSDFGTFKGMFGMKSFFEDNGVMKYDVKDPKYREMVLYINDLFRSGLLDKEWAINKKQTWEQKLASGTVLATTGAYWDPNNANNSLQKVGGEEAKLYPYKVAAQGVDPSKTTYGPRGSLGWDAIAITKANKYPERTMKLINFLASEEGQYLLMWGIEGQHWDMKDGKHAPRPEVLQGFKDDWDNYAKKTGIRKWTWFVKNGLGSDGTPYDLPGRYERNAIDKMALKNLSDTVFDSASYEGLGPQGGTPEALIEQKVKDIMTQGVTKAIMAKSADEANSLFDKMLADMKTAGDEKVEKIIDQNYKERMKLWK